MVLGKFKDVCIAADAVAKRGLVTRQQYTCSHCGVQQTMHKDNSFYERGECSECKKETDIKKDGCNFAVFIYGAGDIKKIVSPIEIPGDFGLVIIDEAFK
jgi:hypothetical protein